MTVFHRSATQDTAHLSLPIAGFPARCLFFLLMITALATGPAWAVTVTLEWDTGANPDLRGYKVFCRLSSDAGYDYERPVWAGTDGNCEVSGLAPGTDYCFIVRAFDADGNESDDSNEVFYPGSQIDAANGPQSGTETLLPNRPVPGAMADNGEDTPLAPVVENLDQPENDAKSAHVETQWQVFREVDQTSLCVYDAVSETALERLQVPPLVLDENTPYYWRSRYLNMNGNSGEWSPQQHFSTGLQEGDSDADGLLDAQAAHPDVDLNEDGIADQQQIKIRPVNTVLGGGVIAVDALNNPDIHEIKSIRSLDPAEAELGPAEGYDLPMGLVAFKLILADGVHSTTVTLHYSAVPGNGLTLLTYDIARGWQSAEALVQKSEDGKGRTVVLTLEDGGIEDVDGVANGILVFTGGYGRSVGYRGTDGLIGGSNGSADVFGSGTPCFIGVSGTRD